MTLEIAGKSLQIEPHANLSKSDLSMANLSGGDLRGANLRGADLSGANLSEANLTRADLSGADLSWANLSEANLRGANLSGANLSRADLSSANLRGANMSESETDDIYYQVLRIGRENRMTTWNKTKDIIWCGCFTGTIEKFEEKIKLTHIEGSQHLHNYMAVINYFKSLV